MLASKSLGKTSMTVFAESRRNASVCGCSSMVEQQLPKLFISAGFRAPMSKTRHETAVSFQALRIRAQNKSRENSHA